MAMQLSIDEKRSSQAKLRVHPKASLPVLRWLIAGMAPAVALFGRAAAMVYERIANANGHGGKRKQMKLVESLPLGNRRQLMLVVCNKQQYLVGAGADGIGNILAVRPAAVLRDRTAKGPELVRRRGRDAGREARSKAFSGAAAANSSAGLDPWR